MPRLPRLLYQTGQTLDMYQIKNVDGGLSQRKWRAVYLPVSMRRQSSYCPYMHRVHCCFYSKFDNLSKQQPQCSALMQKNNKVKNKINKCQQNKRLFPPPLFRMTWLDQTEESCSWSVRVSKTASNINFMMSRRSNEIRSWFFSLPLCGASLLFGQVILVA